MIVVQMYNIFRLLMRVPDYSISSDIYRAFKKTAIIYLQYATKCQMILVVQMYNMFRL